MYEFWIQAEQRVVSFHPMPDFRLERFPSQSARDARLWVLILAGYRFQ